jgi:hypothetical protein
MSGTTTETKLIITTDASGAVKGIKMAQDALKDMESQTKSLTSLIKGHWVSMVAGMVGVPLSIGAAWDLAEKAARFEEQTTMLDRLAAHYHTTAAEIVSSIQNASRGLISLRQATEGAAHGMMMGLDPEKLKSLAAVAPMLARLSTEAKSAGQMFEDLVNAIGAGRTRALQQIVGVIDLHTKFTDAQVSNMSKVEQANARYEMAMDRIKAKLGDMSSAAMGPAERMELLKVRLDDLATRIGQAALPAIDAILKHLQNITNFKGDASGITSFFNRIAETALGLEITFDKLAEGFSKFMAFRERAAAAVHWGDTSKEYQGNAKGWDTTADSYAKAAADAHKQIDELQASELPGGVKLTPGAQARLSGTPGVGGTGDEEGTKKINTSYQDTLAQLAMAQENWQRQVDATNPSLDTLEKKIQAVTDKAKALTMEWQAKEKKTGYALDTSWIDTGLNQMIANMKAQEARQLKGTQIQQTAAYSKADIEGTREMADLTLRLAAAQGQDTDALSLANKFLFENRLAESDISKIKAEIANSIDEKQTAQLQGQLAIMELQQKNREGQQGVEEHILDITKKRAAFEAEIARSIAGITTAEQVGDITSVESTAGQLAAHQKLLGSYQTEAANVTAAGGTPTQDLLNRIQQQQDEIKQLQNTQLQQTGTFAQGASRGLTNFANQGGSTYQQGQQFATDAAKGAQDTFQHMFFDGMQGQWKKGSDYARSFLNDLEQGLANLASKQLMQQILGFDSTSGGAGLWSTLSGYLSSIFGGASGGSTGAAAGADTAIDWNMSAAESAAWGYHSGGMGYEPSFALLPRFHSGIGPGERPAVIRNDEGVFTPGQMRALGRAASGGGATNHISTNVGGIVVNGQVSNSFSASMRSGIENVVTDVIKRHL